MDRSYISAFEEAREKIQHASAAKRIVILTGAHGVGKTTALEVLKRNIENPMGVVFSPEIARELRSKGYTVGSDMIWAGAKEYIRLYLDHISGMDGRDIFFDRGLFDLYIYMSYNSERKISQEEMTFIKELFLLEAKSQAIYVFTPIQFPLIADGVRDGDPKFQQSISDYIESELSVSGANRMTVQGDACDRARAIAKHFELPFKEIRGFEGLGNPPYSGS